MADTHRILDTLDSQPPNAASLHPERKELGKEQGGDEGYSARFAKDKIDQFMANLSAQSHWWFRVARVIRRGSAQLLENATATICSAKNSNNCATV